MPRPRTFPINPTINVEDIRRIRLRENEILTVKVPEGTDMEQVHRAFDRFGIYPLVHTTDLEFGIIELDENVRVNRQEHRMDTDVFAGLNPFSREHFGIQRVLESGRLSSEEEPAEPQGEEAEEAEEPEEDTSQEHNFDF